VSVIFFCGEHFVYYGGICVDGGVESGGEGAGVSAGVDVGEDEGEGGTKVLN